MRLSHWTTQNDVFVPALDDQHKTIFQLTAELQQALQKHAPRLQLQEIVHRLISCAESQFGHEEELMRDASYVALSWHKGQHDTARKRLRKLVLLAEACDAEAGKGLMELLTRWLDGHTAVTDRMMAAHLRNHQRE
jgi:hemerythrin-like metal-binding protein